MKVLIKVQPLGLYNGRPVTARKGEVADLPDALAAGLIAGGLAELAPDVPDDIETATAPTGDVETATAPRARAAKKG